MGILIILLILFLSDLIILSRVSEYLGGLCLSLFISFLFSCEDAAQQVLMSSVCLSVCVCESRIEVLSHYAIFTVPECPGLFQNACRMFQNAYRMFQNVPECMQNVPECMQNVQECTHNVQECMQNV